MILSRQPRWPRSHDHPVRYVGEIRAYGPCFPGKPVPFRPGGSNCGDDTATEIDHEVMKLLHDSYEESKRCFGDTERLLIRSQII